MIKRLQVNNFAIIEDIDISFNDGLTILTGETGAGKSLIIDSISLLLGQRANLEMIRNGQNKAVIVGEFIINNPRAIGILNKNNIDVIDNKIIVTRTISPSKSVVKVNDVTISLQDLNKITPYLADIHMQFDMQKLLNKDNYLGVIDGFRFDLVATYKNRYLELLETTKQKYKEYLSLQDKINKIKERKDIFEYEYQELSSFDLKENEEQEIDDRISLLKNYDKIYDLYSVTNEWIEKDSLSDIYNIKENVNKIKEYKQSYEELSSRLENSYYELEDIFETIKDDLKNLDYDPKEFEELEIRLSDIKQLKKKYNKSIEELIKYRDELKTLLSSGEDFGVQLEELRNSYIDSYKDTYIAAKDLSKIRQENANLIEKDTTKHLSDLSLKSNFKIVFDVKEMDKEYDLSIFSENGIDDVDFLIETNIGEGLKPVAKVISGGEASRIMLALKMVFAKAMKVETIIFDEIDTGISGEATQKVARKIKELSLSTQVIIISHLPQVASYGDHHLKIYKKEKNGRTFTYVKELSLDEKILEIATLISDGKVSEKQLEYAKELLEKSTL